MIERHPDNIAAAMLGGFIGSYLNELSSEDSQLTTVPLDYILPKVKNGELITPQNKIVSQQPPNNIGQYVEYKWNKKLNVLP